MQKTALASALALAMGISASAQAATITITQMDFSNLYVAEGTMNDAGTGTGLVPPETGKSSAVIPLNVGCCPGNGPAAIGREGPLQAPPPLTGQSKMVRTGIPMLTDQSKKVPTATWLPVSVNV